jgi:hypothetical protein
VNLRKILRRRIRASRSGVNAAGDVNVVIAAKVNEGSATRVSTRSRSRIVQKKGRTVFEQHEHETEGGSND